MKVGLYPVAILAGGRAVRLGSLTERRPKALIGIAGEPFIAHQLRLLARQGVRRVVICAGYLGEMIRDVIGAGEAFGVEVAYSWDGERLLGTAGALRKARGLLGGRFFSLYGDSYLTCDFAAVQRRFEEAARGALMTVFRNEGRWDGSNVEFAGGRVKAYDKKSQTPRMRHIDYGLGMFRADVFDDVPDGEPWDLAAVFQQALRDGQLAAYEVAERFYEIGSIEGIEDLRLLLGKGSQAIH